MATDVFELHIQKSLEKLEDLWLRSNSLPTSDSKLWQNSQELPQRQQELLQESLTELSASIEELRMASEILREQNTQLLASQQKIIAEKEYYRDLFDSATDCYIVTTKNGSICQGNKKAIELLGVAPQYLSGKTLAVFVALDCRQEYYTQLNKIKRGKATEANWKSEIITRQQRTIPVEFMVVAVQNPSEEAINLRWRISLCNSPIDQDGISTVDILIDSLRYPICNLGTKIREIQAEDEINNRPTNRHWQGIGDEILSLQNTVNDAYIVNQLLHPKELNLSLVDYTAFTKNLIKQINPNDETQKIYFESKDDCVGICDVMLLKQIIINILSNSIRNDSINQKIEIKLAKKTSSSLIVKIAFLAEQTNIDKTLETFDPLVTNSKIDIVSKYSLGLAAVQRCVYLLDGKINLERDDRYVVIAVRLPLVSI